VIANNPFGQHGIDHLSASSVNAFISSPGLWARQYLAKQRDGGNPKMWRGSAVEVGYAAYLRTGNLEEAHDAALRAYELSVETNVVQSEEDVKRQFDLIEPMLGQCLKWTPPSALNATQIKIEHWFDDVPVPLIGYVDLAFEGIDVDLKTTEKCPSKPSRAHVRQISLYRAARNKEGALLYVTDKKHAYYPVTDEMMQQGLDDLQDGARRLTRLLAAFDKSEDLLQALPIDWDHWMAPKQTVAPRTASAADDFVPVELEN